MLSYMVPVEEKPVHLPLDPSTESTSSLSSAATITPTDKPPKPKIIVNGTKHHPTLKRVSFGSSKGSMVETLIYESPLQEEPEASPSQEIPCPFPSDHDNAESESGQKRVKVTFFECEKPQPLQLSPDFDGALDVTMAAPAMHDAVPAYNRQASTDSGWDNPFRPDGDLSREADEIVELIKGGKPITPTPNSTAPKLEDCIPQPDQKQQQQQLQSSPQQKSVTDGPSSPNKVGANGSAPPCNNDKPGAVEVQRGTVVQPSDASQVEHVVLKKKPKCKCCVIQ